jgi:predicted RNA-binding protein associated with RNAse of E/G family
VDSELRSFHRGEQVVIREVLNAKVWTRRPVTIIEDSADQVVSWLAPGTVIDYPLNVEHGEMCLAMWLRGEWTLAPKVFRAPGHLRIAPRDAPYEVFAPLTRDDGVESWYVNVQRPLQRTPFGFDTMDEILDLVVSRNCQSWQRKDEGELELALAKGFMSQLDVTRIRGVLDDVEADLSRGDAPWDLSWASWRPSHA